mmetsp:Transcript_12550/g.25866  ORF Transcript_12550/g.25866 Transcript_12550/m.25866 type:complete len:221 (-) Transcript_12550:668-1330(-)
MGWDARDKGPCLLRLQARSSDSATEEEVGGNDQEHVDDKDVLAVGHCLLDDVLQLLIEHLHHQRDAREHVAVEAVDDEDQVEVLFQDLQTLRVNRHILKHGKVLASTRVPKKVVCVLGARRPVALQNVLDRLHKRQRELVEPVGGGPRPFRGGAVRRVVAPGAPSVVHDLVVQLVPEVSADRDEVVAAEPHRVVGATQVSKVEVERGRDVVFVHSKEPVV